MVTGPESRLSTLTVTLGTFLTRDFQIPKTRDVVIYIIYSIFKRL